MSKALVIVDIQRDYFPGGNMPLHEPEAAAAKAEADRQADEQADHERGRTESGERQPDRPDQGELTPEHDVPDEHGIEVRVESLDNRSFQAATTDARYDMALIGYGMAMDPEWQRSIISPTSKLSRNSSILPASILDKSRMSLMSASRCCDETWMRWSPSSCFAVRSP